MKAAPEGGEHALVEMAMATHAGMTTDEFDRIGRLEAGPSQVSR